MNLATLHWVQFIPWFPSSTYVDRTSQAQTDYDVIHQIESRSEVVKSIGQRCNPELRRDADARDEAHEADRANPPLVAPR